MQDSDVHMTREAYFEMCEMLGNEPIEEDIPIELSDFPNIVQQLLLIYNILPDIWDTMGGEFIGKDYNILFDLFKLYEFDSEEQLLGIRFLQQMDRTKSKIVLDRLKAKRKSPPT